MISADTIKKYKPTIGIECHVQLNTKTKLFSGVSNDARGAEPNTVVSPICFGMPGVLPVMNLAVIELTIRAGHALNAEVAEFSKFDRKHYFYPDLPKGYQITQFDQPTVGKGWVEISLGDGSTKKIGVTRAHIEEDAGKSTHPAGKDYSLVDLNRAGTPLLEIVSEPDIANAAEAKAYAQELYLLMKYADVSDVDLFQGNMRFDVNVSVAPAESTELGTRSETKNLNSFKSVEKSVEHEVKRQIELLEKGQAIVQETRGWDDAKQKTFSQRSKEDAHDYRYFPEPDIPPIRLSAEQIATTKQNMPIMPAKVRDKFSELGISSAQVETLVAQKPLGDQLLEIIETSPKNAKRIANWLSGEVQRLVSDGEYDWNSFKLATDGLIELSEMVADNKLSSTGAKEVLSELFENGGSPQEIAEKRNLLQVSDEGEIDKIVDKVISINSAAAQDVRDGEVKAIGFLVGQVMKESQGKANPQLVQKLLRDKLK